MTRTRSQLFAQKAQAAVASWEANLDAKPLQEIVSLAKSFPAYVQTCGLIQALAFAESKRKPDQACNLYDDFLSVLNALTPNNANQITTQTLINSVALEYMRISRLALEAATWLKRYASVIVVPDPPNNQGQGGDQPAAAQGEGDVAHA